MTRRDAFQGRNSRELVRAALRESDEDARWDLVVELQRRGTREELELMRELFESGKEAAQRLACDVVAQLGHERRELGTYPFEADAAALLARGLRSPSTAVQQAAAMGTTHVRWDSLHEAVRELARSPDPEVRHAVASALGGRNDDASIDVLIQLSSDVDDDVRSWATFGLGTQCERSDPRVCDALAARLGDRHDETRGEAWVGLALRGDRRAVPGVLASLESARLQTLAIDAAQAYGDPLFLPALEAWQERCDEPEDRGFRVLLEEAIEACRRRLLQ
jgi:hypothetical protein